MKILETDRLILRTLEMSDLEEMTKINQDPKVMEFFPGLQDKEQTKAFIERVQKHYNEHGYSLFAVVLTEMNTFIGFVGLLTVGFNEHFTPATEIGWRLSSNYWGKGFATEAARAVLEYAFDVLNIESLVSFTTVDNLKSRRVMENLGMTHNTEDDFDHPKLDVNSPLRRHVLYRIAKQPYLFEYDGLGFRLVCDSDIDYLIKLDCDPEVKSFFPGGALSEKEVPNKIKEYKDKYKKQGYGCYLVFDTKTKEFIGRAGFSDLETGETEAGYLVVKELWGKGCATRVLKALLDYAKTNLKKDKIIAFTPVKHEASIKVMQKAGMKYVETKVMPHITTECVVYEYNLIKK